MGSFFSTLLNLAKINETQSNKSAYNIENKKFANESLKDTDKFVPYSYTPDQYEDKDINNEKDQLKCIRIIKGHQKWCNCLIVLKSGNLCSCSGDKSINIYSNDNEFNVILNIPLCHTDFILYVLEIYESILASSSSDGTIKFWKLNLEKNVINISFYLIETIYAHESDVWKILFIQKNKKLISCSSDSEIKIWDLDIYKDSENKYRINFVQNKKLSDHLYWVSSIIMVTNINLNINYLVSGSGDNTIKFYNISQNYNLVHSMNKVICCQQGTLVNYDSKRFLIGGGRGIFFYVVNFVHFQVETKVYGGNEEINTILVLKKNKFRKRTGFLLGGKELCFHFVDALEYRDKIVKKNAHDKYIYCLIQLKDNLIVSSSYDNAIKIWKYDEDTF